MTAVDEDSQRGTMDEREKLISHVSWMRDIPDSTPVTKLSIPGTHDSCCVDGFMGFGQTQYLDLPEQLNAGIRFLDIRLSHYRDNLFVHHDVIHMGKSYKDVLDICSSFLEKHPSETILMSIKDEGRWDAALGRYAPSEVLGKSRGDPANWVVRSSTFEDAFNARTWENIEDFALFFNFFCPLPGRGPVDRSCALTAETTLDEVRGKVILLRRFHGGEDVGLDLTHWPEDQCFSGESALVYHVEDHYQDPGEDDKFDFIVDHIEKARRADPEELYITFSSAVNLKPSRYSKAINRRLSEYLAGCPRGRTGIIVMDYFDRPRELVSNVIRTNFKNGAVPDRDGVRETPRPAGR
jgi:1-phosphatidylinositol phosphodiesterase